MSKTQRIAFVVLAALLIYLLAAAARAQTNNFLAPASSVTPCSTQVPPTRSDAQVRVYHITVSSPFQSDQITYRQEMAKLINETFADEEKGIFDASKFKRLKKLANKLRGQK